MTYLRRELTTDSKLKSVDFLIRDIKSRKLNQAITQIAIEGIIRLACKHSYVAKNWDWFDSYRTYEGYDFWRYIRDAPYR